MNPSAFQNTPSSSAPQQQPIASTSAAQPQLNGSTNALDMGMGMDIDLSQFADLALPEIERPKTKKELEQDKKDLELGELLDMMDEWKPIIPDEVTDYYLQRSGFETDDVRVKRLLALAAQRFVSSISADAFQYARTRTASGTGRTKESSTAKAKARTRTTLTMEDLSAALKEYGVGAERAAYYL